MVKWLFNFVFGRFRNKLFELFFSDGQLSEHFTKNDIECKCGCGQCIVDDDLLIMLESTQDMIDDGTVLFHSVNRCLEKNRSIGSADTSQHIQGKAADFHVLGWTMRKLHKFVKENWGEDKLYNGGMACYPWGVHVDSGKLRTWE